MYGLRPFTVEEDDEELYSEVLPNVTSNGRPRARTVLPVNGEPNDDEAGKLVEVFRRELDNGLRGDDGAVFNRGKEAADGRRDRRDDKSISLETPEDKGGRKVGDTGAGEGNIDS